jgi:hypothetical protein
MLPVLSIAPGKRWIAEGSAGRVRNSASRIGTGCDRVSAA